MYKVEIAEKMLIKAERLDIEESEYISYQPGQPSKTELAELLESRQPDKSYEIIHHINGITIKRTSHECDTATSE